MIEIQYIKLSYELWFTLHAPRMQDVHLNYFIIVCGLKNFMKPINTNSDTLPRGERSQTFFRERKVVK